MSICESTLARMPVDPIVFKKNRAVYTNKNSKYPHTYHDIYIWIPRYILQYSKFSLDPGLKYDA